MKKVALAVTLILAFTLISTLAFAQAASAPASQVMTPMKATVAKLQGEVLVTKAGSAAVSQLKSGDVLGSGDKIETKNNGKTEIKMANGNIVNLTPNSQIILSKLASNSSTGEYENLLESNFGTIRAHVIDKVKGKSEFKIKTPTAICGARGTVFYIMVSATGTRVFVTDGSVNFTNPTSGDTFVVVQDTTSISSATGVSEPVELTDADRAAVIAAYEASLSDGSDTPGPDKGTPNAPSQANNPQTPTDNPPPTPSKS